MPLTRNEQSLFCELDNDLRWRFRAGLTFDQAIQVLRDKITVLERCRDAGCDPEKY